MNDITKSDVPNRVTETYKPGTATSDGLQRGIMNQSFPVIPSHSGTTCASTKHPPLGHVRTAEQWDALPDGTVLIATDKWHRGDVIFKRYGSFKGEELLDGWDTTPEFMVEHGYAARIIELGNGW